MAKSIKFNSKRSTKRLYKKKRYKTNKGKYNTKKKRYNTKKRKKSIYQKAENVINKRRNRRRKAIRKMMVGGSAAGEKLPLKLEDDAEPEPEPEPAVAAVASNMGQRVMTRLTLEPFFIDLLVPETLELGKELKRDGKKYICECIFDGKECIFKYDDTLLDGSMRFRVDMRLSVEGFSPEILYPPVQGIENTKYAIYQKIIPFNQYKLTEDIDSFIEKARYRLIDIYTFFHRTYNTQCPLVFVDFQGGDNMGFTDEGELVIIDGVYEWSEPLNTDMSPEQLVDDWNGIPVRVLDELIEIYDNT